MKKTIIITGAAGNLGRTITSKLLEQGYAVNAVLGPSDNPDFIKHQNLVSNSVNLLNQDDSNEFIHYVTDYLREDVEALICLVGGFATGNIEDTGSDSIQRMIDLNFKTAYHVVRPMIGYCKKHGKPLKVILIGSRPAISPSEGKNLVAYGLSKSLLVQLAEYINIETNETGINVSVIVPSTMDTPGTRAAMPNAQPGDWVPLEEVYETIFFVLSNAGGMMREPIYKLYNKA
ncbi:SDR family NAD(P)-dependent oxidoreductase [Flagellimonas sp. 2504JD4-2]